MARPMVRMVCAVIDGVSSLDGSPVRLNMTVTALDGVSLLDSAFTPQVIRMLVTDGLALRDLAMLPVRFMIMLVAAGAPGGSLAGNIPGTSILAATPGMSCRMESARSRVAMQAPYESMEEE